MKSKIKVLFLSPYEILDENLNGVNKINVNILIHLIEQCSFTIIQPSYDLNSALAGECEIIMRTKVNENPSRIASILSLYSKDEIIFKSYTREVAALINEIVDDFDVIHISSFQLSTVIPMLSNKARKKVIFFAIDSKVLHETTRTEDTVGLGYLYRKFLSLKSIVATKYVYSKVSNICFVGKKDADVTKTLLPKNILVDYIPNGVALDHDRKYSFSNSKEKLVMVFHGDMYYPPNQIAIKKLLSILPTIKSLIEINVIIKVIGNGSKELNNPSVGVFGLGFIDDLYDELSSADLYISLVETGAGIKNKILDAMSVGLPILATDRCMEGIEYAKQGVNYISINTNNINTLVEAIVCIHTNRKLAIEMSHNNIECVQMYYSWEKVSDRYYEMYKRLASND
ncbi:glycosyltransferase family 4 protein [Vibrio vulnificus]